MYLWVPCRAMHACVEANTKFLPEELSTLFLRQGISLNLELVDLADWLVGPGDHPSLPPQPWCIRVRSSYQ